jgi:hypothetical protein
MIHTYEINGVPVQTGDVICTMNGKPDILPGEFWRFVGRLVPGEVDHIVIYLGPQGRCIESAALGVSTFEIHNGFWDSERNMPHRGMLVDTFFGVVYPLEGLELSEEEEERARMTVADYCLSHLGKPYNLNFLNPETEDAFYCSQLAYKAYQRVGVNLNTGLAIESLPGTNIIIFPQEIWNGCAHRAKGQVPVTDGQ